LISSNISFEAKEVSPEILKQMFQLRYPLFKLGFSGEFAGKLTEVKVNK